MGWGRGDGVWVVVNFIKKKKTNEKFTEKHNQNPTEEEKKEHAKWYVPTLRTWSNSTFYDALDTKRGEQERKVNPHIYF